MHDELALNELTHNIIGACIEVHRALGPGLLEKLYQDCFCHELDIRGINYERKPKINFNYKDLPVTIDLRADIIVEGQVVVELKSVKDLHPVYEAQLLSYLKLTGKPIGLLVNFNVLLLKDGIIRRTLDALPRILETNDEMPAPN
ncbi:MAG: GxxExxY protein [Candidatus Syntrophosphaera sp.]|nr:GxxExxY protein [Candidatus Syntrophosphaera sp.]